MSRFFFVSTELVISHKRLTSVTSHSTAVREEGKKKKEKKKKKKKKKKRKKKNTEVNREERHRK